MSVHYHKIAENRFSDYGVNKNPQIPDVSFIEGVVIKAKLPNPLIFEVDYPSQSEVPHLISNTIPICSDHLVKTLRSAGVDNFQVFAAVLRNPKIKTEWTGYWAFNAIGMLAAANLEKSEYDTIMEEDPEGGDVPLVGFLNIVLDKRKAKNKSMFRLAESPATLLVHDLVLKHMVANRPPDGWGIDATEVEAV